MLSTANIVQSNSGSTGASAPATTFNITLAFGTTAGNTLFIGVLVTGAGFPTIPGMTQEVAGVPRAIIFRKAITLADDNETSWTCTSAAGVVAAWWAMEMTGVDLIEAIDIGAGAASTSDVYPQTTGTTPLNGTLDTMVIGMWSATTVTEAGASWSGHTNEFVEMFDTQTTRAPGVDNVGLSTALLFPGDVGNFESSATGTGTAAAQTTGGLIAVFRAEESASYPRISYATGFEWGHAGGINTGPSNRFADAVFGTIGTNILVQTGSAFRGTYGLRIVASGAFAGFPIGSGTSGTIAAYNALTAGFWTRVVSATGTVVIAEIAADAGGGVFTFPPLQLVYNSGTTKLGLRWASGGTIAYQTGTTALNTWVHIDLSAWGFKTSVFAAEWQLGGIDQASPANLTGQTPTSSWGVVLGTSSGTPTFTADYDDVVITPQRHDFPLGDLRSVLLKVDPAGTVTVSGSTANFQTFTNNGTLTAWNATTARGAVDEVPPTISASADGVAQTTLAASDYMEFPMETYTLQPEEKILDVRALVCGWAAGAPANARISYRAFDGTTETVLGSAVVNFNNSTTTPSWGIARWAPLTGWDQAKLDAAAIRLGFSSDATPAIGAHAIYLEVLIGSKLPDTGMQTAGPGTDEI